MRKIDSRAAQGGAQNGAGTETPLRVSKGFDPVAAKFLAGASAAAYQQDAGGGWFGAGGFQTAVLDAPSTDTRAVVAFDSEDCVAAFRGTQDLRNWLSDLDCQFIRKEAFRVHRGFHTALESVWEDLTAAIARLECRRLWLTGHSLGGALAMLAAYRLDSAAPLAGVYTFGQPRAGDAGFRDAYDAPLKNRTFRVVHANDVVARIPWLLGSYRHAGHEVFFPLQPSASSLEPFIDPPWWRKVPPEALGLAREWCQGKLALLADHHVDTYLQLFSTNPQAADH